MDLMVRGEGQAMGTVSALIYQFRNHNTSYVLCHRQQSAREAVRPE